MSTEYNNHKFITVEMLTQPANDRVLVRLYSDVFAQSAFEHDITLEEFKLSLDNFSQNSISSIPQIQAWRDEATEIYFELMEKAGKLKWKPAEFLGGSDYEEDNGSAPAIK